MASLGVMDSMASQDCLAPRVMAFRDPPEMQDPRGSPAPRAHLERGVPQAQDCLDPKDSKASQEMMGSLGSLVSPAPQDPLAPQDSSTVTLTPE